MSFKSDFITFGPGRRVHYKTAGEGAAVVFLPGNGCSVADFDPVMEMVAQRYQVFGIDIPGREPSEWPDVYFDFEKDLPSVLDWVLSQLNIGEHVVVGHSMGGMAAIQHARRHGVRVRGAALMEGFVNLDRHRETVSKGGFKPIRMPEPLKVDFERRRDLNARWLNDHPRFRESFWRSQVGFDAQPWIAELAQLPVQVFVGDLGQLLPRTDDLTSWRTQLGMDPIENLELVLVPNAGHWLMLDDFDYVGKHLLGFIDQVNAYR